jgi:hypothetical protein
MKQHLIVALLTLWPYAAVAQSGLPETKPDAPSLHDQIRAERAKDREAERADTKARPWDRNSDGKRPWDTPAPEPNNRGLDGSAVPEGSERAGPLIPKK